MKLIMKLATLLLTQIKTSILKVLFSNLEPVENEDVVAHQDLAKTEATISETNTSQAIQSTKVDVQAVAPVEVSAPKTTNAIVKLPTQVSKSPIGNPRSPMGKTPSNAKSPKGLSSQTPANKQKTMKMNNQIIEPALENGDDGLQFSEEEENPNDPNKVMSRKQTMTKQKTNVSRK